MTEEPLTAGLKNIVCHDGVRGGMDDRAEVMISLMQLSGGMSKEETASQWSGKAKSTVVKALSTIELAPEHKTAEKKGFLANLFG